MATQRIAFGEWLPDQPGLAGGLIDAKNVVSQAIGYGPLATAAVFSEAADENLTTLVAGKEPLGSTKLFAAGASKIYECSGVGVLTDVSKTGGYSVGDKFRFTQFGNSIIGTDFDSKLQSYTLGTSTEFDDLSADSPIAKYITVVRDFVVVAFTNDGTTNYPSRVQWSDLNDETNWTSGPTSQADYQDIPDGGQIVGIRGGEYGLVFLEKAVHRMSYIGTPFIFQFDNISRGKGCIANGSIAQVQGVTFFLSDDGFYMCDGQSVMAIGNEKIDRWFYKNADEAAFNTMSCAVDPVSKLVIWNFKGINQNRYLIIYNFNTKKWTYGDANTTYISDASSSAVTLEELDNISASVDALPNSLDSILYIGGKYFLGGTYGAYVMTYTGTPATGNIEVGDIDPGARSLVTLARPHIDGGSANVSVSSRVRLDETVTYSSPVAADDENRVSLRANGRYHRFRVTPTGDNWKNAIAIDVDFVAQGGR